VICSDVDVDVVAAAQRRADSKPRGNQWNIVFLAADMLRLPFRDAAFDAAVCRWGFMFARDPVVPFREARRVLRNGGRLVFAVWSTPEQNPWQSILDDALIAFGIEDRTAQRRFGGMFSLADEGPLRTMLQDAGFLVHEVHRVPLVRHYRHLDEYWRSEVDVGGKRAARLHALSTPSAEAFRHHLVDDLSHYLSDSGYHIPGLALAVVAVAKQGGGPRD
jgi:SAM-dependent methyltransferase